MKNASGFFLYIIIVMWRSLFVSSLLPVRVYKHGNLIVRKKILLSFFFQATTSNCVIYIYIIHYTICFFNLEFNVIKYYTIFYIIIVVTRVRYLRLKIYDTKVYVKNLKILLTYAHKYFQYNMEI